MVGAALRGSITWHEEQGRPYSASVDRDALAEIERLRADKDAAYEERNQVVAALTTIFPSGIARTDIPGWLPEWHGCVYIDLPTGQVSWHYHDSQAHLFAHLPPYKKPWDGHTTEQKYARLAMLTVRSAMAGDREEQGFCGNPQKER
jgi:hypothetical protein